MFHLNELVLLRDMKAVCGADWAVGRIVECQHSNDAVSVELHHSLGRPNPLFCTMAYPGHGFRTLADRCSSLDLQSSPQIDFHANVYRDYMRMSSRMYLEGRTVRFLTPDLCTDGSLVPQHYEEMVDVIRREVEAVVEARSSEWARFRRSPSPRFTWVHTAQLEAVWARSITPFDPEPFQEDEAQMRALKLLPGAPYRSSFKAFIRRMETVR